MDFLISFRFHQVPRSPPTQAQSTWSKTFTTWAETSPSRGRRRNTTEVPRSGALVELLGTAPDVCGDCSLLDTLLGSGKRLVEFSRFAFLRCLASLPFFAMVAKLWGCDCPCCMLCVFCCISSPGMMDLQNEVLVASPRRRCNLCEGKLQPLGRKHLRRGVICKKRWRCRALELLWSCWGRLRMSVVIAASWIRFWGLERDLWSFRDLRF